MCYYSYHTKVSVANITISSYGKFWSMRPISSVNVLAAGTQNLTSNRSMLLKVVSCSHGRNEWLTRCRGRMGCITSYQVTRNNISCNWLNFAGEWTFWDGIERLDDPVNKCCKWFPCLFYESRFPVSELDLSLPYSQLDQF